MKKSNILVSSLFLGFLVLPASANTCPSADQFKYTKQADGKFLVNPPEGYTQTDQGVKISTGQLYFKAASMIGTATESTHKIGNLLSDIFCLYGVPGDDEFEVTINGSKDHAYSYYGSAWNYYPIPNTGKLVCWSSSQDPQTCRFAEEE